MKRIRDGKVIAQTSATVAAALWAAVAYASAAGAADSGFYAGGSVGPSDEHFDASTFNVGSSSSGFQIALGYQALAVLAGELDYVGFGRASAGINYADNYGVELAALGALPTPIVQPYGRLGLMNWHTDAHSPNLSFDRSGSDLAYGAGLESNWGNLGARIEFDKFEVSHASTMNLATIGLTWRFL
jgi:hypothetical protein